MTQYILLYHDYFDNRKWDSILSKIKNIAQFKQIDKSFLWFLYQKYLMLLYQGKSVKDLDFDFLTNFACLQDFTVKEVKYLIQQVNIQLTKHNFLDENLRIPTDKIKKYNPNFNKIQQPVNKVNKVNNQLTKVNNELTLVNKSVNNELTNELTNNFVNQLTKKYNSLRSFICQIKKGKKRPKTHTLEELEEQLKNVKKQLKNAFVNQLVNNELTTVNNRLTNQLTTVNKKLTGGYRGVTYTDLKENREKRIEKEVVVVDKGVVGGKGENPLTTTTTKKQKIQQVNNESTKNDTLVNDKNKVSGSKVMRILQLLDSTTRQIYRHPVNEITVNKQSVNIFTCEDREYLQDYSEKFVSLLYFTMPTVDVVNNKACNLKSYGVQFDKIFDLLNENTRSPYLHNALTTQEKEKEKNNRLQELKQEAKENKHCSLMVLYNFLKDNFYGKKNNKGYNFDCPSVADLQQYAYERKDLYADYHRKIKTKYQNILQRIQELGDKPSVEKNDIVNNDIVVNEDNTDVACNAMFSCKQDTKQDKSDNRYDF